jgi:hypothetical protein
VTIAIRPSDRGGTVESIKLCLANGEAKYFLRKGWTGAESDAGLICPMGCSAPGSVAKAAVAMDAPCDKATVHVGNKRLT